MNTEIFDLGKIGITLGGEYDNKVVYEKLTIVLYKGKSYISTKITHGVSPEQDILVWQLVAEAKDAYHMLVDAGKITITEEEFLEQLVDATKGRYVIQGNLVNAADEEDLTVEHSDLLGIDTLKLANRDNTNGMGYIILRKNKTFAEQVTKENTIYYIRYDFTLDENVIIPNNCVLKFDGGSISGAYTLTGNNTGIQAGLLKIFSLNIILSGKWNIASIIPQWFGAKINDSTFDNTDAIQKAIYFGKKLNKTVFLPSGAYYTSRTIDVYGFMEIRGSGYKVTTIKSSASICFNGLTETDQSDSVKSVCTETVIRDISFIDMAGRTSTFFDGNCTYCIFDKVQVTDYNIAFNLDKSWGVRFNHLKCLACRNIQKSRNNHGGYENAIYYTECEFYDCLNGIEIYSGAGVIIEKCLFERVKNCVIIVVTSQNLVITNSYFEAVGRIVNLLEGANKEAIISVNNNCFIGTTVSSIVSEFGNIGTLPGYIINGVPVNSQAYVHTQIHVLDNSFRGFETSEQLALLFNVTPASGYNDFPFSVAFLRNQFYNTTPNFCLEDLFYKGNGDDVPASMNLFEHSKSVFVNSDIPVYNYKYSISNNVSSEKCINIYSRGIHVNSLRQELTLVAKLKSITSNEILENNGKKYLNNIPQRFLAYLNPSETESEEYFGIWIARLQDDSYATGPVLVDAGSVKLLELTELNPKCITVNVNYCKHCLDLHRNI